MADVINEIPRAQLLTLCVGDQISAAVGLSLILLHGPLSLLGWTS